jgi:hypothetical protein
VVVVLSARRFGKIKAYSTFSVGARFNRPNMKQEMPPVLYNGTTSTNCNTLSAEHTLAEANEEKIRKIHLAWPRDGVYDNQDTSSWEYYVGLEI